MAPSFYQAPENLKTNENKSTKGEEMEKLNSTSSYKG